MGGGGRWTDSLPTEDGSTHSSTSWVIVRVLSAEQPAGVKGVGTACLTASLP